MSSINHFIRTLDEPASVISYPIRLQYSGSNGEKVLALDPNVCGTAAGSREVVYPLQVIRRPGLGDKVFALAACHKHVQEYPERDISFAGLDNDEWLSYIDWMKVGINHDCASVVNLDNAAFNGGDRCQIYGSHLGVEVDDIRFPINVPKKKNPLGKDYYLFVPFAAARGPRSLPIDVTMEVLVNSPIPLAFRDSMAYRLPLGDNVNNITGGSWEDLFVAIKHCKGVIAVDTGVPYLAAAMGKPSMVLFSHVAKKDRTMTIPNMLAVDSPVVCAKTCGDHVGTTPKCRFESQLPLCMSYYTTEFIRYMMVEFDKLVSS